MSQLPTTFAALGNATRLEIVERLLAEGELSAGALQAENITPPAMSRHFKVLREAGIVVQRVDAQRRLYSVKPEAVQAIGEWVLNFREFWAGSLDRLDAALKEAE